MNLVYEYSEGNRLEKPHDYMYTKYLGKDFLLDFFNFRKECINFLDIAYDEKESLSVFKSDLEDLVGKKSSKNLKEFLSKINKEKKLQTFEVFKEMCYHIVNCEKIDVDLIYPFLSGFCKKYEISKRLFSIYIRKDKILKPGNNDYDDIRVYSLFCFCLLYHYSCSGNFKFLNCAIKVNDMLCSVIKKMKDDELSRLVTYLNLLMENRMINELLGKKGIEL